MGNPKPPLQYLYWPGYGTQAWQSLLQLCSTDEPLGLGGNEHSWGLLEAALPAVPELQPPTPAPSLSSAPCKPLPPRAEQLQDQREHGVTVKAVWLCVGVPQYKHPRRAPRTGTGSSSAGCPQV